LDDVLDLTWDQISLTAKVLAMHRASMIELVVGPLIGSKKKGQIAKASKEKLSPKAKDEHLMQQIAAAGVKVKTRKA
jgi:hypothetical protein